MRRTIVLLLLFGCNKKGVDEVADADTTTTAADTDTDTGTGTGTDTATTTPDPDPVGDLLDAMAPADVTDTVSIQRLATGGSALYAWWVGAWPALLADDDPMCPSSVLGGTGLLTYTGGCTDVAGRTWAGTAVLNDDSVVYEAFGFRVLTGCGPVQQLSYEGSFDGLDVSVDGNYTVNLFVDVTGPIDASCDDTPFTWAGDYSGSWTLGPDDVNGDGIADRATWNGSGRIGRSDIGVVDAVTTDQVYDHVACGNQGWSGETIWSADGHVATLSYDGETDCDLGAAVPVSVDGVPIGTVDGIGCSTAGGRGPMALWWLLPALLLRRRQGA